MKTGRRLNAGLLLAILPFLGISVYAGYVSFWTDSEIWATSAVSHMFVRPDFYEFQGKPLFNFLLWLNWKFSELAGSHPIHWARALFALNSFLMIFLFQRLTRKLSGNLFLSVSLAALLFSNSFFVKRFGEVRSDALVTTLVLSWWLASTSVWWRSLRPHISLIFSLTMTALIASVTPKSLLFSLPWLVLFEARNARRLAEKYRRKVIGMLAGVAALSAYVVSHSIAFFMASIGGAGSEELSYFDPVRLEHVARLLRENPAIALLWLFNFYQGVIRRKALSVLSRPFFDFANFSLLVLAVYPDRLPFLLAAMLPFWFMPLAVAWPELQKRPWMERLPRRRVAVAVLLFCALNTVTWSLFVIKNNGNENQKTFVNWIVSHKEEFGRLTIYDAAGILPFESVDHWFIGPSEPVSNADAMKRLKYWPPQVILFVTKLYYLGPELEAFLAKDYWYDGAGIYIRKYPLEVKAGEIPRDELKEIIYHVLPSLRDTPWHKVYLELQGVDDVDLSRYGKWLTHDGDYVPFNSQVAANEMGNYKTLIVPRGTVRILMMPIKLTTPFSLNWAELFRFNPEI